MTPLQKLISRWSPTPSRIYESTTKSKTRGANRFQALQIACLTTILTTVCSGQTNATTDSIASLFEEEILAANVSAVRNRAARMPAAERCEYLKQWVLPSKNHLSIRMPGEFTQTDPPPVMIKQLARKEADGSEQRLTTGLPDVGRGGQLVSPVFDLLVAARETGQLESLLATVEAIIPVTNNQQQRAHLALLSLIHLELRHQEAAAINVQKLHALAAMNTPVGVADQWPETLVVWRAIDHFHDQVVGGDLLTFLFSERAQRGIPAGFPVWQNQIAALAGRNGHVSIRREVGTKAAPFNLSQWIPYSRMRAHTRGSGYPQPEWTQSATRVDKIAGHDEDYLFFESPLLGDFEVECDIASTQVLLGGALLGSASESQIHVGNLRIGTRQESIPYKLRQGVWWVRCRRVIRGDECLSYFNGQLIRTEKLPSLRDPWLAVRSWSRSHGNVRDLRITGSPVIPERVLLSGPNDLAGWVPYYNETVGYRGADWNYIDGTDGSGNIRGFRATQTGSDVWRESLLTYGRPLGHEATIKYEFVYQPESTEVHPALDRLVFLLRPEGVRLHWISDGPSDTSDMTPDLIIDEPKCRRGSTPLKLKVGDWNHVTLAVKDDVVTLSLNGHLVFQRQIDATSRRTFGLFHWSDQSEAIVRNVTMSGNWPRHLPPVWEQELADKRPCQLDVERSRFPARFVHNFSEGGLPPEFFATALSRQSVLQPGTAGVSAMQSISGPWSATDIKLPFMLHGDFDVEAEFDELRLQSDKDASILLNVILDEEKQREFRLLRIRTTTQKQYIQSSVSTLQPDGSRSYITPTQTPADVFRGRLRLARRGDKMHYLFSENDSDQFQLLHSETVSRAQTRKEGVQLRVLGNGVGEIQVVWKNVRIDAERMTLLPTDRTSKRALYMMDIDGTNLHKVSEPKAGFKQLGSTEWSSDGQRLVCDMSEGDTSTSHIMVLKPDGSAMSDLGPGCMPSFSRDGLSVVFSDINNGIVRMKADGTGRKTIERSGWGTQWSPDGRYIVWGHGPQLTLMNTDTEERRQLLTPEQSASIGGIYWNLGWSHDSKWIAFKCRNGDPDNTDSLVAVISIEEPNQFRIIYRGPKQVNEDFTWHPDNKHVVCAMRVGQGNTLKLVKLNTEGTTPATPELLPGQPEGWDMLDCDWSPDGRKIIFAASVPPEPVEWHDSTDFNAPVKELPDIQDSTSELAP